MADLLDEEQPSEGLDMQRVTTALRRYYLIFIACLFLGWAAVWGATWVLPAQYKSTTAILIEQSTVPTNYVQPNVTEDIESRMQSFTEQLLSRSRLVTIIDTFGLYKNDNQGHMSIDDKVDRMRKDIEIQLIQAENGRAIEGFSISFKAGDPRLAQAVATDLSDLFISENLHAQEDASESTTTFISKQLEDAQTALTQQEEKVKEYEAQHEGVLPSQQQANLQILAGLQSQLQNAEAALNASKQQGIYLETLLNQMKTLNSEGGAANGQPSNLAALDQQLETLRAKLSDLRSDHTELYPDVLAVKDEIARTEKVRADLVASMKKAKASGESKEDDPGPLDRSSSMVTAQLEGQLKANQADQANREHSIEDLKNRIRESEGRLNAEPASEQEMADLTRGYEQSKQTYDDLLKKKNESSMATSMELAQQGERFSVLDAANLPTAPDFPNRLKFCGIGLGVGLVLAVFVTVLLTILDDRLYTEKEIGALLPMGVLSEIPEVVLDSDERRKKGRTALGWTAASLVVVIILSGFAFSYYHG
jgi:polysaccharide chain length determinant protein (PEP-CTERM system associated)